MAEAFAFRAVLVPHTRTGETKRPNFTIAPHAGLWTHSRSPQVSQIWPGPDSSVPAEVRLSPPAFGGTCSRQPERPAPPRGRSRALEVAAKGWKAVSGGAFFRGRRSLSNPQSPWQSRRWLDVSSAPVSKPPALHWEHDGSGPDSARPVREGCPSAAPATRATKSPGSTRSDDVARLAMARRRHEGAGPSRLTTSGPSPTTVRMISCGSSSGFTSRWISPAGTWKNPPSSTSVLS